MLVEELALLGEADATRCSMDQPRCHIVFKTCDTFPDRGTGEAEPFRRQGEALVIGDTNKGAHIAEMVQHRKILLGTIRPFCFHKAEVYLNIGNSKECLATSRQRDMKDWLGATTCLAPE